MRTWWLSFGAEEGHRGVAIVDALDEKSAVETATRLGINPGGEILIIHIPSDNLQAVEQTIVRYGKNRLIPASELLAAGEKLMSPDESEQLFEDDGRRISVVHEGCNSGDHE